MPKELQTFTDFLCDIGGETGDVPTWTSEALHEPFLHWKVRNRRYDGNRLRRTLRRADVRIDTGDEHVNLCAY